MAGKGSITKRLRMTLDFEVEVEELTDESLRRHYERFGNSEELVGDAEVWANLSRQIRLQRALLDDEEALGKYLTYAAVVEVDASTDSRLGEVFGVNMERAEEFNAMVLDWLRANGGSSDPQAERSAQPTAS